MRQVVFLLFQHHTFWKKYSKHSLYLFKRSIKLLTLDIFPVFTCKKTVQKISQFSCFHYTSACFHAVVKSIWQILYHFQKPCVVKTIRYKNCAELFVFNGNKRPIGYELHNGVKPNRYNGNRVLVSTIKNRSPLLCRKERENMKRQEKSRDRQSDIKWKKK